jgi:hypothetical protein
MPNPKPVTVQQIIPRGIRNFKITASTATGINDADGNPVQWTYTVSEVYKSGLGYGNWTVRPIGESFTEYTNSYNFLEDANDGTGVQQNGVDHDSTHYPTNFQMMPLQTNSIHPGVVVNAHDADGNTVYEIWLMPFNGEDGAC